jgi:hypothetical protein
MKKLTIILTGVFVALFCAACTEKSSSTTVSTATPDQSTTEAIKQAEPAAAEKTDAPSYPVFNDWHEDLPTKYKELKETKLDINGDGLKDIMITYVDPNVVRAAGDIRTIKHLKIFRRAGKTWEKIKEDEVTQSGGVVEMDFCILRLVNLGADKRDEVLASKCSQNGSLEGYYIFGMQTDGGFDDFAIPRGYLHDLPAQKPGENKPSFSLAEVDGDGVHETYYITCNSRPQEVFKAYGTMDVACRKVVLFISFKDGKFSPAALESENILIDGKQSPQPEMGVDFFLPSWLGLILDPQAHKIEMQNYNSKVSYFAYFAPDSCVLNLNCMPAKEELMFSDDILDKEKIDRTLSDICESFKKTDNWPEKAVTCVRDGNLDIVKIGNDKLRMIRLYPGTSDHVIIDFTSVGRNINYFDEAVMKRIIDSFSFTHK